MSDSLNTMAPAARATGENDLISRLRACGLGMGDFKTSQGDFGLCDDAADEIERLRAALKDQDDEV